MMVNLNRNIALGLACISGVALGQAKPATIQQASDKSICANVVALTGNIDLKCSDLTDAQKKALASIPAILKMALTNQSYLEAILKKLDETSNPLQSQQNISGGINIQQGTSGNNSPIVDSPITVGAFPKTIPATELPKYTQWFQNAKAKVKTQITADQYSGAAPLPDDFYQALRDGGWEMPSPGVTRVMAFYPPGKIYQGVVIKLTGEPIEPNQQVNFGGNDPITYICLALKALQIPFDIQRSTTQPEGLITLQFVGGFPSTPQ